MKARILRNKYDILTSLALSADAYDVAKALSSDPYEQQDLLLDSLYMVGQTTEQRLRDLWQYGRGLQGVVNQQRQFLAYLTGNKCNKRAEAMALALPPRYAVVADDQLDALPMADADNWAIFVNLGRSYSTMAEVMQTSPAVVLATIERIVNKAATMPATA